ncbi:MAG: transposase [Candidatus Levyibacteriota bacterium]
MIYSALINERKITEHMKNVRSHMKQGISGVYRVIAKKYLQAYADAYAFRYNH